MQLWGVILDSIFIISGSSTLRLLGPRLGQKAASQFKGFSLWAISSIIVWGAKGAGPLPEWYHEGQSLPSVAEEDWTIHPPLPVERVAPLLYGKYSAVASTAITLQENPLPNNLAFIYSGKKTTQKPKGEG